MNDYVNKIQPKLSGKWQADEQMIRSKGKWKWCWNILDENTRFLIANQVTKKRSVKDARKVFRKAKQIAKEKPESISTDGLWSYEKAIQKEFIKWRHPQTEHIRLAGISKKRNNNKIERFHGSFRERDKVMRGFKGQEQVIANGFRTYYNFIRPHQALNGLTPSEMANINLGLNGGNRWVELLNKAINQNYNGLTLTNPMVLTGKKRKRPRKTRPKKIKTIYKVRIFSEGKEYDNKDKKFKTEFKSEEKALEFIEFYKLFYPSYEFRIGKE